MTALDVIENDILTARPLPDLLRKVLILSQQVGSDALQFWASQELNGYELDAQLPEYRRVQTGLYVDSIVGPRQITGQPVQPWEAQASLDHLGIQWDVGRGVELRQPLAELVATAAEGEVVRLAPGWAGPVMNHFDTASGSMFQQTIALYFKLPHTTLLGVTDRISTQLTLLVTELRKATPRDAPLPTPEQAHTAIVNVFGGSIANINVGEDARSLTINVEPGDWQGLASELERLGVRPSELDELQEIVASETADEEDPRQEGTRSHAWIRKVGARLGLAATDVGTGAVGGVLGTLVSGYLGLS